MVAASDGLRHVRALADEMKDRAAGTPGEAAAARYILEAARSFTRQAWLEPFLIPAPGPPLLGGVLGLAGALLCWWRPVPGLLLMAAGALIAAFRGRWQHGPGPFFRSRTSQNVVAVVPPAGRIEHRVVVVAHCDPPVVSGSGRAWRSAAGIATALAVGERLAASPLAHTEVWCVFTGGPRAGMRGMGAFLGRYGLLLVDASFFILEGAGAGALGYLRTEGAIWRWPASPRLLELVEAEAAATPGRPVMDCPADRAPTQASLVRRRGFEAIALVGDRGGSPPDAASVQGAADFLCRLAARIDETTGGEAPLPQGQRGVVH